MLQPIVDLQDQSAFQEGECLLRWRSETVGEIPPDRFLPGGRERVDNPRWDAGLLNRPVGNFPR